LTARATPCLSAPDRYGVRSITGTCVIAFS
jgi:hypothetical protein